MPHNGMVDALHNIWLSLSRRAILIDLRPVSGTYPIEAITPDATLQIGEVDASGMAADDAAADRAMQEAVDRGWFTLRRTEQFDFAFWWDTVPELTSFLDGSRRAKAVTPSHATLEATHRRLSAETAGPVRLRWPRRTALSSYAKAVAIL